VSYGKNAWNLDRFARAAEALQWQQEHKRLGGTTLCGLTDDKIEESGVMCRKKQCAHKRNPTIANTVPKPFVLYWSDVHNGSKAPDTQVPLASTGRHGARKKEMRAMPQDQKKLRKHHLKIWKGNPGLQADYKYRYERLLAERRRQPPEQLQVGQRISLDPPMQTLWNAGSKDSLLSVENLAKTIAEQTERDRLYERSHFALPGGISAGRRIAKQDEDKYLVTFPIPLTPLNHAACPNQFRPAPPAALHPAPQVAFLGTSPPVL